jgi:hypothetical protein
MNNVTDWFPGCVRPAHVGVYETLSRSGNSVRYQHWDGHFWGFFKPSPYEAQARAHMRSQDQYPQWRGLAKPE